MPVTQPNESGKDPDLERKEGESEKAFQARLRERNEEPSRRRGRSSEMFGEQPYRADPERLPKSLWRRLTSR